MELKEKILVVDDERLICQNIQKILTKNNYEIIQAESADDALAKLAADSYSLLISDIVMPGKSGLDLLKLVKAQWPLTKAIMMTAYASTDTAAKAIRMGALDYLPKPFTPDELRSIVDQALTNNELEDYSTAESDGHDADDTADAAVIDVDIPFRRSEVAQSAGEEYADTLGPSDMPMAKMPSPELLESYCGVGAMKCDIYKKLGATCKAGIKTELCPQEEAKKRKALKPQPCFNSKELVGIDLPFKYEEVVSVTGPEYVDHLGREGASFVPYEALKRRTTQLMAGEREFRVDASEYQSVLVIDDEASVNNNIRKILVRKGYIVEQAFTKAEALEKIRNGFYDLALLDLRIPGVKNLELLEAVRDNLPETKVIIITGYASIETAKETARMGAVDYLSKPFTPDEISLAAENAFAKAA